MNRVKPAVIIVACIATVAAGDPARRIVLMGEYFEHEGAFPPPGWTVDSQGPGPDWSLAGNAADYWTRCNGLAGTAAMDERLISPVVNCTGYATDLVLKWWNIYRTMPISTSYGYVEVSTDGGGSWTTLKTYDATNVTLNPDSVFVPQAANQPQVRFRFRYVAPDYIYRHSWELDDIRLEAAAGHDVGVDSLLGPSTADKVRAGAAVRVWARVRNYTSDTESDIPVTCTSSPGGYSSSVQVTVPANSAAVVSFPDLWIVPASGAYTLTAATALAGDGDSSNDASSASGLIPVSFAASNPVLLNWADTAERDKYQAALNANAVGYNSWDRGTNGNLYGLDAWDTVIFAEEPGLYPVEAEQVSLMRFLDEGSETRGQKYLLLSGNNIGYFYSIGTLKDEFFRTYLHALCDGGYVNPSGNQTYSAAPCSYIGNSDDTGEIRVNQTADDKIGSDAEAETLYAWQWEPTPFPVAIQFASPSRKHVFLGFQFDEMRFAAERTALLGRILAWFAGPPAPAGTGPVSIGTAGTTVTLTWATDPSWVCPSFRVYRATSAYAPPGAVYQEVAASPFVDPGAAGNTAVNYFYRVAPVDFGVEGAQSATVGEFDYQIDIP